MMAAPSRLLGPREAQESIGNSMCPQRDEEMTERELLGDCE